LEVVRLASYQDNIPTSAHAQYYSNIVELRF